MESSADRPFLEEDMLSSPQPPQLPPRPVPGGQEGDEDEVDNGGNGCRCGAVDPVHMESAWEHMSALRANGGGPVRSGGIKSARVRVGATETLDLRIFCGTWNVAAMKLDHVDEMGEWLDVDRLDEEEERGEPPDMFVVGFQEVVELSAQNVVMDSFLDTQSRANSLKWFTLVYAFLVQYGQRHGVRYTMVSEQRLLGTYVLVMATAPLSAKLTHVHSAVVPTGLGGILGNKGAVAVRMVVAGASSLCFVCVHMAAHRENVVARNAEYKLISSKPIFADTAGRLSADPTEDAAGRDKRQGIPWGSLFGAAGSQGSSGGGSGGLSPSRNVEVKRAIRAAMAFGLPRGGGGRAAEGRSERREGEANGGQNGAEGGASGAGVPAKEMDDVGWVPSEEGGGNGLAKTITVLQADLVFWIGDLNYRIAEEVADAEVLELIRKDDLETLRNLDQLNLARATGTAFQEFQEGPLCFAPTYKYIPGTREFDNRPEKKTRCPSWCDRVLYSVGTQGGDSVRRLALDRYWSSGPLLSDHMPVSALFRTSLVAAPEKQVTEPEIEAEPLSPTSAAAAAAFESVPFPAVTLDPPALVLVLTPALHHASAVAELRNAGGLGGRYHVCKDSLPRWMKLDGDGRWELGPGEKAELGVVVDAAAAEAAVGEEQRGKTGAHHRPAACAVLRVEVDQGGSGALLPVVCMFADR